MQETIQQKIDRVKKFGMNDVEVMDSPEDEIQVLMAQIAHLEANLLVAREGLETIKVISDLHASGRDCGEMAEIALMNSTIRSWRKVSGVTPLTVHIVEDKES